MNQDNKVVGLNPHRLTYSNEPVVHTIELRLLRVVCAKLFYLNLLLLLFLSWR